MRKAPVRSQTAFASLTMALYFGIMAAGGAQQQPEKTVRDGVYASTQADRGKAVFAKHCSQCHGELLTGGTDGRALKGDVFLERWDGESINSLYINITPTHCLRCGENQLHAPPTDAEKRDVVSYILQQNGFPAGSTELQTNALTAQISGNGGVQPAPAGTLVRAVGCLAQGPDKDWILTNAQEPTRTRSPNASDEAGIKAAAARPLGALKFRLLAIYDDLGEHRGHKMEVKGLMMRQPNNDGISVESVQMVGSCPQ